MFELIDEGMFAEIFCQQFEFLDKRYAEGAAFEILLGLREIFDDGFDTSFVIIDRETGKPMNCNAVVNKRDAAEDFLKIVGSEKYEIGILLRDK